MPEFRTVERVIAELRRAALIDDPKELGLAIDAAEEKFNELIGIIDRLRRGGGELPEADPASSRSS